ncbi:hypothetical protein POSPLADRAFT_1060133 [Postia placenta MAD-698-R-SB12]|uniref:Uncharacterized protein n=1 Tax=Postia placenta MAD-698-R-SB12 TaxID=670580 RepID=A0A1X6MS45_9APHY|nr:hypothetical protein POSPLADRAFT_1060133 [Postia placenta MAD-698-R-SB12]OSX59046.1 hypothetical protein POSPLADRAFT_1060133 [Postia placenta MAD-698-R-SB12]
MPTSYRHCCLNACTTKTTACQSRSGQQGQPKGEQQGSQGPSPQPPPTPIQSHDDGDTSQTHCRRHLHPAHQRAGIWFTHTHHPILLTPWRRAQPACAALASPWEAP